MEEPEVIDKRILIIAAIIIIVSLLYVFFFLDKPLIWKVIDAIPG